MYVCAWSFCRVRSPAAWSVLPSRSGSASEHTATRRCLLPSCHLSVTVVTTPMVTRFPGLPRAWRRAKKCKVLRINILIDRGIVGRDINAQSLMLLLVFKIMAKIIHLVTRWLYEWFLLHRTGLDQLYKLSYLWYSALGAATCVFVGLVVSMVTGKQALNNDVRHNPWINANNNRFCRLLKRGTVKERRPPVLYYIMPVD